MLALWPAQFVNRDSLCVLHGAGRLWYCARNRDSVCVLHGCRLSGVAARALGVPRRPSGLCSRYCGLVLVVPRLSLWTMQLLWWFPRWACFVGKFYRSFSMVLCFRIFAKFPVASMKLDWLPWRSLCLLVDVD